MNILEILAKKNNNIELNEQEIKFVVEKSVSGEIKDYQISSFLTAMYINGSTDKELEILTREMIHSGDIIEIEKKFGDNTIDKHSTGGVGDKISFIVGPLFASFDYKVAKMSGRGLGHTGGTLDKLDSIKGFKSEITNELFEKCITDNNLSIISPTGSIVPADGIFYHLRDATSTVMNTNLIASSIMSKKLAIGAKNIVLDVKVGNGSLNRTFEEAKKLSEQMLKLAKPFNKNISIFITDMDAPLGNAVGNSLEVIESVKILKGDLNNSASELAFKIVSETLCELNIFDDISEALEAIKEKISNGSALNHLKKMIEMQGGDSSFIDDYSKLPSSKNIFQIKAKRSGFINEIKSLIIGTSSVHLGAGRFSKEDVIDYGAGIIIECRINDKVNEGDLIATVHTNKEDVREIIQTIENAILISDSKNQEYKLIHEVMHSE